VLNTREMLAAVMTAMMREVYDRARSEQLINAMRFRSRISVTRAQLRNSPRPEIGYPIGSRPRPKGAQPAAKNGGVPALQRGDQQIESLSA
jgi:hypothetical protein